MLQDAEKACSKEICRCSSLPLSSQCFYLFPDDYGIINPHALAFLSICYRNANTFHCWIPRKSTIQAPSLGFLQKALLCGQRSLTPTCQTYPYQLKLPWSAATVSFPRANRRSVPEASPFATLVSNLGCNSRVCVIPWCLRLHTWILPLVGKVTSSKSDLPTFICKLKQRC